MINAKTQLNMVIGYPLSHTKSPLLHNTLYQKLRLNAVLLAFPHENLTALVDAIKQLNVGLTAVTMPYKQKIIPFLNECSEEVKELNAANTIINRENTLIGYNTDIAGIEYVFRHEKLTQQKVLIIGAGGAARAAAYFFQKKSADFYWINRTKANAKTLQTIFGGTIVDTKILNKYDYDIIINTTPIGMYPTIEASPLPGLIFQKNQKVFDMIYNPEETLFIKTARAALAITFSGLEMFIGQGLKQVELWMNQTLSDELSLDLKTILIG